MKPLTETERLKIGGLKRSPNFGTKAWRKAMVDAVDAGMKITDVNPDFAEYHPDSPEFLVWSLSERTRA